ncbi:MAG: hypothetical protein QM676_04805 [Novosphingobium sp.]
MGRLFNLLVILSVLWCGPHLMAPAGTEPGLADSHAIEQVSGDCHDGDGGKAAHSGHHHCPSAPALRFAVETDEPIAAAPLVFAGLTAALASHAQAPPLEPPTA